MNEKSTSLQLQEPASPDALLPDSSLPMWWIAVAIAAVAILAMLVILWKRRSTPVSPAVPRKAAFVAALAELDRIGSADARSTTVQCSLILRKYLVATAKDPALFETHDEFISRHDALQALTQDARVATESGLARLALLKYAPEMPAIDPKVILTESRALLETLHHGFNK